MMIEDNKALARRANGMWATGNRDVAEEVFTPQYVNHQASDVGGGHTGRTLEDWKTLVADYHAAFGESRTRVLMQIAEGDLVATRWEFTATQTGTYLGHPPNGRTVTWTGVQIDRIEDGKIAESWVDWDMFRLFEELGLIDRT